MPPFLAALRRTLRYFRLPCFMHESRGRAKAELVWGYEKKGERIRKWEESFTLAGIDSQTDRQTVSERASPRQSGAGGESLQKQTDTVETSRVSTSSAPPTSLLPLSSVWAGVTEMLYWDTNCQRKSKRFSLCCVEWLYIIFCPNVIFRKGVQFDKIPLNVWGLFCFFVIVSLYLI